MSESKRSSKGRERRAGISGETLHAPLQNETESLLFTLSSPTIGR